MKESGFIKQNKDKWQEFEHVLDSGRKDPEKLSQLFTQVTDDLSYSRTFYPNRSVRVYLNNIAIRVFHSIYKSDRFRFSKLRFFFAEELPYLFWEERKVLRLSMILFFIGAAIGCLSSIYDPHFAAGILGDDYVEKTKEFIRSGDPMAIYKSQGEMPSFLMILQNNLMVSFVYFVTGVLAGIGSLISIFRNGIMVGVFQWFFIERGVWKESAFSIWIHGTLEISGLIIESAAGLLLGRGLLFPGSYSRLQSFIISGRKAAKLLVASFPLTIIAAILEGFATRHTEWPYWFRGIIILGSLFVVLYYFWWLPRTKAKEGFVYQPQAQRFQAKQSSPIHFLEVKNNGELLADAILFLRKHGRFFLSWLFGLSLLYALSIAGLAHPELSSTNKVIRGIQNESYYFRFHATPLLFLPMFICTSLFLWQLFRRFLRDLYPDTERKGFGENLRQLVLSLFFQGLAFLPLFISGGWNFILILICLPICQLLLFHFLCRPHLPAGLRIPNNRILRRSGQSFFVLLFSFLGIGMVIYFFNGSSIMLIYEGALNELLPASSYKDLVFQAVFSFFLFGNLLLLLGPWFISLGMMYFSGLEKNTAWSLRQKMQEFGKRKRIQGLEQETKEIHKPAF